MSCIAYFALQHSSLELLLSVFFTGRRDVALERAASSAVRDEWRAEREQAAQGGGSGLRRNNRPPRAASEVSGAIEVRRAEQSSSERDNTGVSQGDSEKQRAGVEVEQEQLVVVWHSPSNAPQLCHALLCRAATTNTAFALQTLCSLYSVLAEQHKSVETVFAVKPDEVLLVLERLLPSGCLLALTGSLVKHLKREADVSSAK